MAGLNMPDAVPELIVAEIRKPHDPFPDNVSAECPC
jgi:hypothetical protein